MSLCDIQPSSLSGGYRDGYCNRLNSEQLNNKVIMFLVCGEALYDLFPEDNSGIGSVKFDARVGGSPFNVAIGLARLKVPAALLTGISSDMLGEKLTAVLKDEGVSTDYLIRTGRRTTLSLVGLDESGSPSYSFYGTGSADCGVKYKHFPVIGDDVTGLHFGSYSTVVRPVAKAFGRLARLQNKKFISYDPNVRLTLEPDLDIWRAGVEKFSNDADLIKISREDYDLLYSNQDPIEKVRQWFDCGVKLVILTDGGKQINAWSQAGFDLSVTPPSFKVIDTVGAGDTFQAAMLKCLLDEDNPKQAITDLDKPRLQAMLNYAATAAALTCTRRGADLPRLKEMDTVMISQAKTQ